MTKPVEVELLLDMLSRDRKKAITKYILLMEQEDDYNPKEFIINDGNTPKGQNLEKKFITARKPLDQILTEAGVNPEEFELCSQGGLCKECMETGIFNGRNSP